MAELTPNPTPTSSCCAPEAQTTCCEPMFARPPLRPHVEELPVQSPAECVRQAHQNLENLDQVDFELGSTSAVRQLLRTDMLERLARCEPLVGRRHPRLPRLGWRRRVAPTNADMRSPQSTHGPPNASDTHSEAGGAT